MELQLVPVQGRGVASYNLAAEARQHVCGASIEQLPVDLRGNEAPCPDQGRPLCWTVREWGRPWASCARQGGQLVGGGWAGSLAEGSGAGLPSVSHVTRDVLDEVIH